jgi:hypothetical protein
MGKTWGVIGGFLMGAVVMMVVMFIIGMVLSAGGLSGVTLALIGFGYFAGYIASIYFGYGFSYDTGYGDCKNE